LAVPYYILIRETLNYGLSYFKKKITHRRKLSFQLKFFSTYRIKTKLQMTSTLVSRF